MQNGKRYVMFRIPKFAKQLQWMRLILLVLLKRLHLDWMMKMKKGQPVPVCNEVYLSSAVVKSPMQKTDGEKTEEHTKLGRERGKEDRKKKSEMK